MAQGWLYGLTHCVVSDYFEIRQDAGEDASLGMGKYLFEERQLPKLTKLNETEFKSKRIPVCWKEWSVM